MHSPRQGDRPPFVLFSGAIGEAAAVAAIHLGFADYLSKSEHSKLGTSCPAGRLNLTKASRTRLRQILR